MVKAKIGTSALAGLALFAMGSTATYGETLTSGAIPPTLKIDGFTSVNTYFVNQQQRGNGKGGPQPHIGVDSSNIYFSVLGVSSSGLEYMYRITFETIPLSENVIDQNYIQFKSKAGTIQLGNTVGPEDTMPKDASYIIGGTGGFDGGFHKVFGMSAGIVRGNDNIGDTGNATKIVYYSPELMGWQVGVAYTPSTAHKGDNTLDNMSPNQRIPRVPGNKGLYDTSNTQPYDLRNVAIGVTYKKEMGKWNITLSGAGITAKSYFFDSKTNSINGTSSGRVPFQNTKAYQLGFILGYGDLRVGGGYLDNGKSHLPIAPNFTFNSSTPVNLGSMNNGNAGYAWNMGAGYTMGAYQLAASYQRTNRNTGNLLKAHSDFYSATVDVTPLQGLKVYTEVDYIRSRSNDEAVSRENNMLAVSSRPWTQAIQNNAGLVGVFGTKIAF